MPDQKTQTTTSVPTLLQQDLYQQARIALRDRLGIEPGERWVAFMVRELDSGTEQELAIERTLREFRPKQAEEQTFQLTHDITVTVTTGDVVASVTLDAGAYPGTARKTLHSIIDRIADQIGSLR